MAQNVIQLHSSLETNRKRKHTNFADKVYGIVTDGRAWYFVAFIDGNKPQVSIHSETPSILDFAEEFEPLEKGVERILGRIVWVLKEAAGTRIQ
jgi:hypothetical protein